MTDEPAALDRLADQYAAPWADDKDYYYGRRLGFIDGYLRAIEREGRSGEALVAALERALEAAHPEYHPLACEVCRIKFQEIEPARTAVAAEGKQ